MADVNEARRTGVVLAWLPCSSAVSWHRRRSRRVAPPVPPISRRRRARTVGPDQRPERRGRPDLAARASVAAGRHASAWTRLRAAWASRARVHGGSRAACGPRLARIPIHRPPRARAYSKSRCRPRLLRDRHLAALVVAIIPFVVTLLDELLSDPGIVGSFGWRLLALVPLVYLVRAGILRAREHDADVRASTREPEVPRVLGAAADRERPTSLIADPSKVVPAGFVPRRGGDESRGTRPAASAWRSSTTRPRSFASG